MFGIKPLIWDNTWSHVNSSLVLYSDRLCKSSLLCHYLCIHSLIYSLFLWRYYQVPILAQASGTPLLSRWAWFALKMQIHPKEIDILGNNLSISQSSCLQMCDFSHKKHYMNAVNCTQLNQAVWFKMQTHAHASNICQFHNFTMNQKQQYFWHLLPWANFIFFFFKVKCYIYSDIYIFLSHLTCIKTMPPF